MSELLIHLKHTEIDLSVEFKNITTRKPVQ